MTMKAPATRLIIILLFIFVYLISSLIYVFGGRIHLDEGAYVYASALVYEGKLPYRDFFFLQTPVYPYVYGAFMQILGYGLVQARLISVMFGFFACLAACMIAGRLGGRPGMAAAAGLLAFNPFQIYFFTITRLYALTAFFFTASCYLILDRKKRASTQILSCILMALAVCTRLTVLPALPVLFLYIWLSNRRKPLKQLLPAAAGCLVLLAVIGFFYFKAKDEFYFNILGLNLSLHSRNLAANLFQKARAVTHLIKNYFLFWLVFAFVLFYKGRSLIDSFKKEIKGLSAEGVFWIFLALISGAHFSAKIFQESYQTFLFPLACATVGGAAGRIAYGVKNSESVRRLLAGTFFIGCLLTFAAYGRTSLSLIDGHSPVESLERQAEFIRAHTAPEDYIFSADSPLAAAEAGRHVLPGMAGSDYFPHWPTERCLRYHVTNDEILLQYIEEKRAKLLIIGDASYTLTLPLLEPVPEKKRKKLTDAVERCYHKEAEFSNLFVPGTKSYFYLANEEN